MCAIGGIYLKPNQKIDLRRYLGNMLQIQHHRGPDAQGVWCAQALGLCHNRLSILDLTAAGNQPMHSADRSYTIVFNGEIYNYRELQQQLSAHGSKFFTNSDTEVILECYRRWGEAMLLHLRGMFAFALYDHKEDKLFCARDRIGKKPFVYAQSEQGFIFASEIPAVKQVEGVNTAYDHDAIAALLLHNLRHIPDPHTAYRGIKRLRAGHAMVVKRGRVKKTWRYWTPAASAEHTTPERLRAILEQSIALRMRADVPIGALLSGGIDSSAVVNIMCQHSTQPIHTYALGFDENDEDILRARKMSSYLGTIHKEYFFCAEKHWQIFNKLIKTYGEPIMLLPLLHSYILCRAIRDDGIKVVLNGNGADELFYGYLNHPRTLRVSQWLDRLALLRPLLKPLQSTRFGFAVAKAGYRKAAFYRSIGELSWDTCLADEVVSNLANRAAEELGYWGELCPSSHYIDESNFVGLMVENTHSVTTAGDLPAMLASIETRSPFLDQEIVEFALATSARLKIPDVNNPHWLKAILRDAVKDLLPASLLSAPKRGFGQGIQESDLLRGAWQEQARELLNNPHTANGFFAKDKLQQQWKNFLAGKVAAAQIAKIVSLQCWLQKQF